MKHTRAKKFLSLLLAVCLLVGALPMAASATSRTPDEAIAWARSKIEQSLDYDGENGCQCVDFIMYYYQYLGVAPSGGSGKDYAWNALPSGWTRVQGGRPQKGDILVYGPCASNEYGHVAIYESDYSHYHQNWDWNGKVTRVTYLYNGIDNPYWGYIRPNWGGGSVDLGSEFYARIINTALWKELTCESSGNVVSRSEDLARGQIWKFNRLSNGGYSIINTVTETALTVEGGSTASGANVCAKPYTGSTAQIWYIWGESAKYQFVPQCSPKTLFEVAKGSSTEGTNIQMQTAQKTAAQYFQIWKVKKPVIVWNEFKNIGNDFFARILNTKIWKPITKENNDEVVLKTERSYYDQIWHFKRNNDGTYKIFSPKDGKCLTAAGGSTTNNANVSASAYKGTSSQKWYIYGESSQWIFRPQSSFGCVLNVQGNSSTDGTNINISVLNFDGSGKDSQKMQIWKVDKPTITDPVPSDPDDSDPSGGNTDPGPTDPGPTDPGPTDPDDPVAPEEPTPEEPDPTPAPIEPTKPTVAGFSDVFEGEYYADAVKWAVESGVTSGTDKTHFSPSASCTRAQAVTFLWRALGKPEPAGTGEAFADVTAGSYYEKAVQWAVEQGITSGTGKGKFSPNAVCTRAQIVTFLYRAEGSPSMSGGSAFSDVAVGEYYENAVKWAVANNITAGTGGGKFSPGNNCVRGQIVTFLYRNR